MTFSSYLTVEWAPTNTPLEASPTWVNITTKVRAIDLEAGARSARESFGIGRAVFDVNNKGRGVSPWLDVNTWYRGRQIRVRVSSTVLFHGWIRAVEHDVNVAPNVSTARIEAVDVVGLLSEASGDGSYQDYVGAPPQSDPASQAFVEGESGFFSDWSFRDVLDWLCDSAGITNASTDADYLARVTVFIPATRQVASLSGIQPYLDADCQGFITRDATTATSVAVFTRYKPFALAAAASTCTLTDAGGNYKYLRGSLKLASPDETYLDRAVIGGKGFDPQTASDTPTGWTPTTVNRTSDSPLYDRNWAAANAEFLIAVGQQTNTYPRELSCQVTGPTATSVDTSHPAVVARIPGANAFTVVYDSTTYKVRVISIRHRISISEGWRVTFGFSSLDRYTSAYTSTTLFTLGTSSLAGTDIIAP